MLAKEAKYEHGLKKSDYDYDEVMNTIRDNNNASRGEARHGKGCCLFENNKNLFDRLYRYSWFVGTTFKPIIGWFRRPR